MTTSSRREFLSTSAGIVALGVALKAAGIDAPLRELCENVGEEIGCSSGFNGYEVVVSNVLECFPGDIRWGFVPGEAKIFVTPALWERMTRQWKCVHGVTT